MPPAPPSADETDANGVDDGDAAKAAHAAAVRRFDLHVIHETLRGGKASDLWLASWLPATYEAPEAFQEALYGHLASKRGGLLKSRPTVGFDFYHDCVLAHVGKRKTALFVKEPAGAPNGTTVTYETLHQRCSALVTEWARAGVVAGESVAVVLPVGVEYAVALLTALRMGLVVTTLPPVGPAFVRTRLAALDAQRIVSEPKYKRLLGRFAEGALGTTSAVREAAAQVSHTYGPDDVAMRAFSQFRDDLPTPRELPAKVLHPTIFRDALVVFALDGTDTLAAPGFDPLHVHPTLLLTCFAAGATFAELAVSDVEAMPSLVEKAGITVLGIERKQREWLLRGGATALKAPCRTWFRSLTDVLDMNRWDDLGRRLLEAKMTSFGVVMNAASGGAHLFSARSPAPPSLRVFPAPGDAYQLSEVAAGVVLALNDVGVYTVLRDGEEDTAFPRCVLSRIGDGYIYTGTIDLGPNAQTYPAGEVQAVVEKHPAVRHAAVILTGGRWVNDAKVVLLLFVDADDASKPGDAPAVPLHEIRSLLTREMGEALLPHRIETFPLRPRFVDGVLDRAWCRSQYLSGALTQKARSELFVLLARVGNIFAGEAPSE